MSFSPTFFITFLWINPLLVGVIYIDHHTRCRAFSIGFENYTTDFNPGSIRCVKAGQCINMIELVKRDGAFVQSFAAFAIAADPGGFSHFLFFTGLRASCKGCEQGGKEKKQEFQFFILR